jgi:hypothetical protein
MPSEMTILSTMASKVTIGNSTYLERRCSLTMSRVAGFCSHGRSRQWVHDQFSIGSDRGKLPWAELRAASQVARAKVVWSSVSLIHSTDW